MSRSHWHSDLNALRERLQKDLAKVENEITCLAGRLANRNFAGKAQPQVATDARHTRWHC